MLLNILHFKAGGECKLVFDEENRWVEAIWSGSIENQEAVAGAKAYLEKVPPHLCQYLLNNNLAVRGPLFDSVEWLERAWMPQAERLGLRHVAHVVQADTHADVLLLNLPAQAQGSIELQVFDKLNEAKHWLRSSQVAG
jgi:hypothetical protein